MMTRATDIQYIRATRQLTATQRIILLILEKYSYTSPRAYENVSAWLQAQAERQQARDRQSARISKALRKAIA